MELALDFSDVLIKPRYSNVHSRSYVDLERNFKFLHSPRTLKNIPIMCANMDTIVNFEVFKILSNHNMFTAFHKFVSVEEYTQNKELLEKYPDNYAISIGMSDNDIDKLKLINQVIDFKTICIDIANGYLSCFVDFCLKVRNNFPDKIIIAGNVVCKDMTNVLLTKGKVDIVKVGIGGGSACTTRIKTGVGFPQLSSVMECSKEAHILGGHVISDGGITCPGDLGKAFGAGADFVMVGGQFAGHTQSPGEVIEEDGKKYKLFYGMSSSHAMKKNYGKVNSYRTSEGRSLKIKYKGDLNETISDFLGGLRSLCTYSNCEKLDYLVGNVNFIRVHNQFNKSLI